FLFTERRLTSVEAVENYCRYRYFHPLTDRFVVHDLSHLNEAKKHFLHFPEVHLPDPAPVSVVRLDLQDSALESLSRERVLALTLGEMTAIRDYYASAQVQSKRASLGLPEWPTDVELEIIAQTWSEHCKHKIFNASIRHRDVNADGQEQETTIKSLYKTYI